ncbi:MAG: hypothetical protein AAGF48_12925 [Pseudomonadota bacterium]
MATMSDIVTRALKRLRVNNPRQTPDGVDISDGLDALNDMMHSWKGEGVDTDHDTLKLSDVFPLDDEHIQGVSALLAVRLASDHGTPIPDGVARDARMGWGALQAEFVKPAPDASFEPGLTRLQFGRYWARH